MHSQSQLALDRHLDIWDIILEQLLSLGHGRKSILAPLVTVSRQLSAVATARIWEELDSLYPLLALFYTRTGRYRDWEWNAIAQTTRCLDSEGVCNGEIQTDLASWGRYEHYASHVRTLKVKMDGAYRNWIFLLPIKRLAVTRRKVPTAIGDQTLDCFPPLLPNLVSLTFELQYSQNLDHAIAVLTAPSAQLLGIEALAGLLLLMPPTLRHLGIIWTNSSISELFTSILDNFTKEMANPASPTELNLGLVGTDYGFLHNPPGDYLTAIPRSHSLVSFRGFSASVYMIEALGNLPCLSEIDLYHMPGHEAIPYAHEYIPRLPNNLDYPYPSVIKLRLLICHKEVEDVCRILSHFPVERLQSLELEFTRAYGVPQVNFMEPVFALVGQRGRALRTFSLVYDAEMWDYIPPSWDVENSSYSLSPWSSFAHLLGCHELETLVIKCAGLYHGLVLSNDSIKVLGSAWPRLKKLCISETLLGVDVVKQSTRPRLVNMGDLAEIALAFPLLDTLHLTLDVDHVSTFASLKINYDRPAALPLDLDLGYSPLVGNVAGTVASQLLTVWPGLRSLRTYWKEHRPVGVHAIYLNKWREVLRLCGSSVVDGHNTSKCNDGYEEQVYWKAV